MREYSIITLQSKELKRDVEIFISVPEGYDKSKLDYPVLYMHDGHNIFDNNRATYGYSWGILEAYEKDKEIPELIIIGLGNVGEDRLYELAPFEFTIEDQDTTYGGKTDDYLDFIINSLKPLIDEKYRTLKDPLNTGIMGSSLGGVCSLYVALKYSEYFSRFGCVSNAFFVNQEQLISLAKSEDISKIAKIYLDVGTKESSKSEYNINYLESNQEMYDILKKRIDPTKIKFEIIEDAIHNEAAWEMRFPDIIKYLFMKK